ncbi:MAG TPA: FAD-dependent oxidoreductase [Pseudorhodoplanes sp.]|nr:FAD-dependent oxidoreductase [Pseudorhodoplanes sp.]
MTPEQHRTSATEEASDYDVIVLGSGAGGMTAAVVAASRGLQVLLIEKSPLIGGTTAISGGMAWIPANSKMKDAGLADTLDEARKYLERSVGGSSKALQAFIKNGDRAIRYLEEKSAVRFQPVMRYPDYYPDLPGATLGGRVLEPVSFDGRLLGRHFPLLRPPLPEFTLFGGMMLDRRDIPHFRKAARSWRSALRVARLLARHSKERLTHIRGTSLVLGNALAARLLQSLLQCGVTLKLNTKVEALLVERKCVRGVSIKTSTGSRTIRAKYGVVLATGGIAHSARLRVRYLPPGVIASATSASDTGDGISLAEALGAAIREGAQGNGFWAPLSRFQRQDGTQAVYPHTVTDRSKPGLIAVTRRGKRFTNEARSYHEFGRAMLHADIGNASNPAYLICDRDFLWKYGLGAIKPFTVFLHRHLDAGYLHRGASIRELATEIGIDPDVLDSTMQRYNHSARAGTDPEFGRGGDAYQRHLGDEDVTPNPCVRPIERPPYYALAVHAGDLGTAAGLATDPNGQVLSDAGTPIAGLYACGNDMASVMDGAYPGPGITLGPALTFGFLIGERLAALREITVAQKA